jgi:pimeloyl-ACP methyl ester carboxylesterase
MSDSAQSRYLYLQDGLRQHYLFWDCKNSNSTPCLLLHGFTNDAYIWSGLAHRLQKNHQVYAIDFRGHGDSDWDPQARYTHDTLVKDVADSVRQLGLERFHLVGHSLGARIAALYVQREHPAINSFVNVDTGPEVRAAGVNKVRKDAESMPTRFDSISAYEEHLAAIYMLAEPRCIQSMAKHGLKQLADGSYTPKTDPAFAAALWNPDSYNNDASDLRAPLNDQLWQALASIEAPSLILKGQVSAILARTVAQRMVNQVMPRAELITIPGAGHAVMVDNPQAFEQETAAFIERNQ